MSDTSFGSLSPEENAYFETGGNSEIPGGEKAAETETTTTQEEPAKVEPEKTEAAKTEADKVEKMVSLSALHEERGRRKAIEAKQRETETALAELRGKFSIVEKLNAPKVEPAVEAPTVETDIFGVVKNQGETIAQLQARLKADDDQRQADGEHNSIVNAYRMDAAQFAAKNADFKAAYDYMLNSRAAELMAIGYDDPAQLHAALQADEMAIAKVAFGNKKSAAEIIYNLAKQRGYAKPEPVKEVVAEVKTTPTVTEKIDAINKGQAANKSLSNTGGSAGDGDVTGEMLLKMPMDEFEKWCEKNPAKAKRLMGG